MAWIELHQGIHRHRKIMAMARLLDIPRMSAVGHMTSLWLWSLDNAPDGILGNFTATEISLAAEWDGDPGLFLRSLREAGWIDGENAMIHDWHTYAGKLIERRQNDAKRKRDIRKTPERHPVERPQDIPGESAATLPYPTVPGGDPPPSPPPNPIPPQEEVAAPEKNSSSGSVRKLDWLLTLQKIPGWKDDPHEDGLLVDWAVRKGLTEEHLEQTANAMLASILFNEKRGVWEYIGSGGAKNTYTNLRATLRKWAMRPPLKLNGAHPRRLEPQADPARFAGGREDW